MYDMTNVEQFNRSFSIKKNIMIPANKKYAMTISEDVQT